MPQPGKGASGTGDAIAEGKQGVHKVNILKEYVRHISAQLHIGEVPEALDAQIDQTAGHGLGTKLSKYETKEEKAGGLYIDIYYIDDVKRLTMLSDYIVLDGVSYKTNDDLTKLLQPYMDNYFLSNGYEEYVE